MSKKSKKRADIDQLFALDACNREGFLAVNKRVDELFKRDNQTELGFKSANSRIEEIDSRVKFLMAVYEQNREAERAATREEFRKNTRIWPSPSEMGMFLVGILFGAFLAVAIIQVMNQPTNAMDVAHQVLPK